MFTGGDPDGGAAVFGMERGGTGDLADVADGVLVGGGVPVDGLPLGGVGVGGVDENGDVFGVERILFSVDYPYSSNAHGQEFLQGLSLSETDLSKIAHGNADRILKLSPMGGN